VPDVLRVPLSALEMACMPGAPIFIIFARPATLETARRGIPS
jgi:hypothetical protein